MLLEAADVASLFSPKEREIAIMTYNTIKITQKSENIFFIVVSLVLFFVYFNTIFAIAQEETKNRLPKQPIL